MDGELGGAVEEGLTEFFVVDVMFESKSECLGDLLDVVGIELSAERADDFGDGGGIGAGDGDATGHRFEGG